MDIIMKLNKLKQDSTIYVGQALVIPKNNKNALYFSLDSKDENIKIVSLIKIIKKLFNSKKKVYFKRKPLMGHYDKTPFTYQPKVTKILNIKPSVSLRNGIFEFAKDTNNIK